MSRFHQYLRRHGFPQTQYWDTRLSNDLYRFRRDPEKRTTPGGYDSPSPDHGYVTRDEKPEKD